MKRFTCYIVTLIILVAFIIFYQSTIYVNAVEVEIHGQIGGNETIVQPPNESETKTDVTLAQPKQTHIALKTFPNTGSVVEKVTPLGLLLVLIYLLLNRWKAHRKNV